MIRTGLESLIDTPPPWLENKRLGLLCNPASVNSSFVHAKDLLHMQFGKCVKALFSPQHGLYAEKQDNMIESDDFYDPTLKMPVYSLYGKTRWPTSEMMDQIDVLIIDLQDVGTRVYTFLSTVSYCLEEAAKTGKTILILDRPNPVNGVQVEGNCLQPELASFVGRYPIPMRHGLTIGEYAGWINERYNISCDLAVIPMQGWQRNMHYRETGLHWVAPSPNLPTPESAMVYPGQVIWEGTNISEGRGTTQPFELFGAPFVDIDKIVAFMGGGRLKGCVLRPTVFEPTANKWKNIPCHGFQIHVTEPARFVPYEISLKLLAAVIFHHGEQFEWKLPPYEYESEILPIDLIIGNGQIRKEIEAGRDVDDIMTQHRQEITSFMEDTRPYRLYQ